MSQAVSTASLVLPTAIAKEVKTEPKVVAFARNAPAATDGHTPGPNSMAAANANPLGGHTGLALGCRDARVNPSLASKK
jgi:hypothetical protein